MKTMSCEETIVAVKKFRGRACGPDMLFAVQDGLGIIYQAGQEYVPIDQGDLAASMDKKMTVIDLPRQVSGKVTMWGPNGQLPYAWMREVGGTIRPKPSNPTGRLWWRNERGQLISAVEVTQKGSFYIKKATESTRGEVKGRLRSALTGAFQVFD